MGKIKLVLFGVGGHALSVLDSIGHEYEVVGFVDELECGKTFLGKPIWKSFRDIPVYETCVYHIATGHVELRKRWWNDLKSEGMKLVSIIDKTACVSKYVSIGEGNFIGKHAIINPGTTIGNNNVINTKALIEHGCIIGSHCNLSTSSVINGDVIIGNESYVGSNAVCNGQIHIGSNVVVGSGAVVTKDVTDSKTVVGIPAKEKI